ncbi:MAG: cold shock domain-containing protein [Pseudomonadales bacterium]
MSPLTKNIIISVLVGIIAFVIVGYLQTNAIVVPSDGATIGQLIVIILAVFIGGLLSRAEAVGALAPEYFEDEREVGTVKWFNVKKGYGFITRDAGDDVFVHYRNIRGQGRRSIAEGQRVEFEVVEGDKGLQADEVEPL